MTSTVAAIGAGTMRIGIAYVFAVARWQVTVVEPDPDRMTVLRREVTAELDTGRSDRRFGARSVEVGLPAGVTDRDRVGDPAARRPDV